MAEDDKQNDASDMSEDEKLAAEWEAAMTEAETGADAESDASGDVEDEWAAAMAEAEAGEHVQQGSGAGAPVANVMAAPMEEFDEAAVSGDGRSPDLEVILDIPVTISMEVGNTQIPIRNLLQLNQGSVIELDRLAGEPLDVLVNGTLIAHGEVVMVNEKFGIRLTDVMSPGERIRKLTK